MSGILIADWKTGVGSDATAVTAMPLYEVSEIVYDINEYTNKEKYVQNPYKIIDAHVKPTDISGTVKLADKNGAASDGTSGTATSPWFYNVVPYAGGTAKELHEVDCKKLSDVKTQVDTDVDSWTDPS